MTVMMKLWVPSRRLPRYLLDDDRDVAVAVAVVVVVECCAILVALDSWPR